MAKNIFSVMRAKKKRPVDPNTPPRPTLLGHEKEMKTYREQFKDLSKNNVDQTNQIILLKRKISRMQGQIDALTSIINRNK